MSTVIFKLCKGLWLRVSGLGPRVGDQSVSGSWGLRKMMLQEGLGFRVCHFHPRVSERLEGLSSCPYVPVD